MLLYTIFEHMCTQCTLVANIQCVYIQMTVVRVHNPIRISKIFHTSTEYSGLRILTQGKLPWARIQGNIPFIKGNID